MSNNKYKVIVEPHTIIDKSFGISVGDWFAKINFNDVDHVYVDAMTRYLENLIDQNFVEWQFHTYLKEELYNEWINDKELREEHGNNLEEYIKTRI